MRKMLIALCTCVMLWFYQSHAAISFSWAPRLDAATATSLKISWDSVPGALGYYLYYSETSWVGKWYDKQYPDLIETTTVTLSDLESWKKYFIALTAIDQEWEESPYSTEVNFSTVWGVVEQALSVEWLKINDKKTLTLDFSLSLDDDVNAVRDIKIVEKKTWNELDITGLELDWEKALKATLVNDLLELTQYDITIISVFSKSGKNIEAWIDGLISFTTPAIFNEATLNKNILEELGTNENNNLNSADTEVIPVVKTSETDITASWSEWTNAWINVSNEELNKNTVNAVNASKELPTTGPEHILLLIISLLIGTWVFYFQRKKQFN